MMDPFPLNSGDSLDRLLGMAAPAEPGPWFTTRTMARCLTAGDEGLAPFRWTLFFKRWALPGVFALFLGGLGLQQAHRIHTLETHRQQRVQEAFEVMASLSDDSDSSTQDNSL